MKSIDQTAARWLARRETGLSAAQEAELACWLDADPRHAESFRRLQHSWSRLDGLRGSSLANRLEAELLELPIVAAQSGRHPPRPRIRFRSWLSGALAASVAWAVAYFAIWRPLQSAAPYVETGATEIGVVRTMALPDGSIVRLNTNTLLQVVFTSAERRVRLSRGEAFFTIAENPSRPFIVTAAGVDVRAVGTEFNVRLHAEAIEVVVREGKVRIDDASNGESLLAAPAMKPAEAEPPILSAGNRVVIPVVAAPKPVTTRVAPVPVARGEIARSLAWQDRRLVFESAPLATIVAEFNRYNRHQLTIAEAELAARQFGGTFEANDPKTFVELLRSTYDIGAEERAGETILRVRR